jgi:DNA-binding IclR family transcriptional regulator
MQIRKCNIENAIINKKVVFLHYKNQLNNINMIQVVNRALNILEFIASDSNKEFSLSEIANTLELQHSTCANILKTLVSRGYVEQTKVKGNYKLGIMIYHLSNNGSNSSIINATEDLMIDLRNKVNETVILSVIKNQRRIVLSMMTNTHEIQVKTIKESSVYSATTGRVILAHYTENELNYFIEKVGLPSENEWPGINTKKKLREELYRIKTQNIEITLNKNHVIGLATPIIKESKIIASLGIYLPDFRYGDTEKKLLIAELLKTTEKINAKIDNSNFSSRY